MDMLCLDFMYSDFRDFRGRWVREDLRDPAWMNQFLARWNLQVSDPLTSEVTEELIALRTVMRHIVERLPDKAPPGDDLATLNTIIARAPITPRLIWEKDAYRVDEERVSKDWTGVMAQIALSFTDLLTHHDLKRIKICENPYCVSVFYDETKSRTKRWCTNNKCGNLWKLRRFRARHGQTDVV